MPTITTNFPVDLTIVAKRDSGSAYFVDRLRGSSALVSQTTAAQINNPGFSTGAISFASNISWSTTFGEAAGNWITLNFRRAPGFFDVVCYTGTGANRTINHNLGVAPELIIVKARNAIVNWSVFCSAITGLTPSYAFFSLNTSDPMYSNSGYWAAPAMPTASIFNVGVDSSTNGSGSTYVAYLFATCPGVSKVGSYTGNGSSQTINCGFTGGARFVLIKRTDSTGDWYVWDTSRGIVAGNDPHLSLNSTTAEVTTNDSIDTDSTGFIVNQLAATNINVSSATYIYLAIA